MVEWEEIVEFFKIVGDLKRTYRKGWLRVGIRPESVADHVYRTTFLAMLYADLKGLNVEKVMRMALLHDFPEAITGDLTPAEKTAELKEKEHAAISKILSYLPEELRRKYEIIWKEFEEGKSKEAKIVKDLDKLEMILQALEYQKEGYNKEKLKEFWKDGEKSIRTPEIKRIYRILKKKLTT